MKSILSNWLKAAEKHAKWLARIEAWRKDCPLHYDMEADGQIPTQYVIEAIYGATGGGAIIATEVGQHQMWAAQFYLYKRPRTLITSGGLGTMGYGLPAAIGAQIAAPQETVFCIAGDGSIQMNIQDLATAVAYNLPVKIAIINNGYLGMVRQWQEIFYQKRYAAVSLEKSPDFVKLAEAFGALGLRAEKTGEVVPAITKALSVPGPVVIDFRVRPEENVYPMVPPNKGIDEMIRGDTR